MLARRARIVVVAAATIALFCAFIGPAAASPSGGDQGCTPGYWKTHASNWPGTNPADDDYGNLVVTDPGATLGSLFGGTNLTNAGLGAYRTTTLLAALSLKGGSGVDGAGQILFRAAAAAWLNAADDRLNYLFTRFGTPPTIHSMVLGSIGNREAMLIVATTLDNANNGVGGCPL